MALAYVHNQNVIAKGTESSSSGHHYFIYPGVCTNKEQIEDGNHDREENDFKLLRDQALEPNYVSFVNDGNEATGLQNAIMNAKVIIAGECNGSMG